jgi:hypothetical protein
MKKASTPHDARLTAWDRRRLRDELSRTRDARVYRRIQAVLLWAAAWSSEQIRLATGLSRVSVYRWVRRYLRDHGRPAFEDAPRSGRPVMDGKLSRTLLRQVLKQNPRSLSGKRKGAQGSWHGTSRAGAPVVALQASATGRRVGGTGGMPSAGRTVEIGRELPHPPKANAGRRP